MTRIASDANDDDDLGDQAYRALRAEIIQCNLPPGVEFTEAELCARYGFSRSPLRKALALLSHEDLIAPFRRRGYRVAEVTLGVIKETFELRAALESYAVRMGVGRFRMDTMRALNEKFVAAARKNDVVNSIRFHEMIHMEIYRASGNHLLEKVAEQLLAQTARFHFLSLKMAGQTPAVPELPKDLHETLFSALEGGDPEQAAQTAAHHVERTQKVLVADLISAPTFRNVPILMAGRASQS